jgi:DNA-binding HxlR family transcriptional regulator
MPTVRSWWCEVTNRADLTHIGNANESVVDHLPPTRWDRTTEVGRDQPMRRSNKLLSAVVQLLDGRWTLAVLVELADGGRRYQDLDDALDGVSHKVLTDTLRRAESDGLVVRHLDPGRVETATPYQLTELGRSLDEPLVVLDCGSIAKCPHMRIDQGVQGSPSSPVSCYVFAVLRPALLPSASGLRSAHRIPACGHPRKRNGLWGPRTE